MKVGIRLVSLLIAVMLLAVGCSSAKLSPQDALQQATAKTMGASSYAMTATVKINEFTMDDSLASSDELGIAAGVAAIIKDATINVKAVYEKDPARTDMNLEVVLPGFMNMKLDMPIIVADEKIYFKLPQIPMLPIPQEAADKFILLDAKELAKQEGVEVPELDMAAQQKFAQDLTNATLKHFDEKTYFTQPKASEAGLPEGVKADQVVKFAITEANYEQTISTVIDKVLPEVMDLIANNEAYLEIFEVEKADVEDAKQKLTESKEEIRTFFKDNLKVKQLDHTGAIKGGNLVYQETTMSVEVTEPEASDKMSLGMTVAMNYSDIGQTPKFESEIPTDVISFEEFLQLMEF
ncbi:hypothetical protein [Paenibacillus sp. IITD108]|uniref:hypothetical protein n=1 Tax=Paenibacillus sp. IITD108 TaxID=3116649 RepID=UPI002F4204FE